MLDHVIWEYNNPYNVHRDQAVLLEFDLIERRHAMIVLNPLACAVLAARAMTVIEYVDEAVCFQNILRKPSACTFQLPFRGKPGAGLPPSPSQPPPAIIATADSRAPLPGV